MAEILTRSDRCNHWAAQLEQMRLEIEALARESSETLSSSQRLGVHLYYICEAARRFRKEATNG